jgi:hypothetical protein
MIYGSAWSAKRPTPTGIPQSSGDIHWFDGLHVYRAWENNGALADGPHDLGVPPGTDKVLGVCGVFTGDFAHAGSSWTEIRVMVHNPSGIQFFRKAANWGGPVDANWIRIG